MCQYICYCCSFCLCDIPYNICRVINPSIKIAEQEEINEINEENEIRRKVKESENRREIKIKEREIKMRLMVNKNPELKRRVDLMMKYGGIEINIIKNCINDLNTLKIKKEVYQLMDQGISYDTAYNDVKKRVLADFELELSQIEGKAPLNPHLL
jgi:hypothetical protein